MKKGKIAVIDIDGCLCPSIFKNIKHNDNGKLQTPEFLCKLETVEPYQWAREWDWKQYEKKLVITGRLEEWKKLTEKWLGKYVFKQKMWNTGNRPPFNYLVKCVEWDDSLPTREESGKDYVRRKVLKCAENIAFHLYLGYEIDVFDDDERVMNHLMQMWYAFYKHVHFYIINDGERWEKHVLRQEGDEFF